MMKKFTTLDAAFYGIISFGLHFYPKDWYSVVGRSSSKANNVVPFWSFFRKHYLV